MRPLLTLVAVSLALALLLSGVRDSASAPAIVEERVSLQCLTPVDAAELVRHRLADENILVTINPNVEPGLLRILATPTLLKEAKDLLAIHDGAGSFACLLPRAIT